MPLPEPRHGTLLACEAMGTRFEICLADSDRRDLRAIGEELLREIEDLDRQLNCFSPQSELASLNARAARRAVPVEPGLFQLLQLCRDLWEWTGGRFDPTVGPLMAAWGWFESAPRRPGAEELSALRLRLGMDKVELEPQGRRVRFDNPSVWLNLGAVAKGYALDRCATLAAEFGLQAALFQGGTSSVRVIGHPPGQAGWKIALAVPGGTGERLGSLEITDGSLGVSSGRLQRRSQGALQVSHIFNPLLGEPEAGQAVAAVVAESAAVADALSTALLVECEGMEKWRARIESYFRLAWDLEGNPLPGVRYGSHFEHCDAEAEL